MRIHSAVSAAVNEAAATAFQVRYSGELELLTVSGVPDGATVSLLLNNTETGTFVQALDPYGTPIGIFVNKVGSMMVQFGSSVWGKVIISGGGGSQVITVDYGTPA